MTREVPVGEVTQLVVDCNDPAVEEMAHKIAAGLVERVGVGTATAVSVTALYQLLWAVMHATTPVPEANVAQITTLLDELKAKVLSHTDCALHVNNVPKKQRVH
jgi:hypothetical protein